MRQAGAIDWRSQIEAVLSGQQPERIPAIFRLSRWYRQRRHEGTLPPGLQDARLEDIEDYLGLARSARYAKVYRIEYRDPVSCVVHDDGDEIITAYRVGERTLRRVARYSPGDRIAGLDPTLTQFPISSWEDYDAFERIMDHLVFVPTYEAYGRYDDQIGRAGLPMVVIGGIPFHYLLQEWTGYERGFLDLHDRPDVVLRAVDAGNRAYRRMWEVVAESSAKLVLHGINFDVQTTPPPLFREHFLPYLRDFAQEMHGAGKRVALHADGDLTGLWDMVLACGFDVADCLACPPLVSSTVAQARQIWNDRIALWGGLPSPLLEPTACLEALDRHLDQLLADVAPGHRFMLGITDMAMPTTDWTHLLAVRAWLGRHGELRTST